MELRQRALAAFVEADVLQKTLAVAALGQAALGQAAPCLVPDTGAVFTPPPGPGRPDQPVLVEPQDVPRRSPFTPQGLAALLHSVAHIEFNAINLALDAVWRFPGLPAQFYTDWLQVAVEEARHFCLLQALLEKAGHRYGDFSAHDGLWTICESTRHSAVERMALVPRTLEARGLDATPLIQQKLRKVGTPQAREACGVLDIILREEIGHVATGNHWYHWLCQRDHLDPIAFYTQAAQTHNAPKPRPPFNLAARRQAGFTGQELQALG